MGAWIPIILIFALAGVLFVIAGWTR